MIDPESLAASLEKDIRKAVDASIEKYVAKTIAELTLDEQWVNKVQNLVNQNFVLKFDEKINRIDINLLIRENLDAAMDRFRDRLKENFRTKGLSDYANSTELTILDRSVVIENQMISRDISIEQNAEVKGALTVNDLIVKGTVNTDNVSWDELTEITSNKVTSRLTDQWKQDLVKQVLDLAKRNNIDFNSVTVNGQPLVDADTLSPLIKKTSIEKTGTLSDLTVAGYSNLNETLMVNRRRVGVNTENPEMALSVWDEEVSLLMGKLSQQQAYIGTGRLSNLAIGINRIPQIELNTDGLTTIKQLRVGKHRIGHVNELPGFSGTRGDILFNADLKPGQAFAWVCLGGYKWQPLKSA